MEPKHKKFGRSEVTPLPQLSIKQLEKLVNEECYCVEKVRKRIHVTLPPSSIGNESKYVMDHLNYMKWHYQTCVTGFVLGFDKVSFTSSVGTILTDHPYIHEEVEADFYVFRPQVGSILKGSINRISTGLVGCLVHGFFNISINLPRPVPCHLKPYLKLGETVLFEVKHVQLRNHFLRVHCKFSEASIQKMCELMPHESANEEEETPSSLAENAIIGDKESVSGSEDLFPASDDCVVPSISELSSLPKKKKHKHWECDDEELSPPKKHKRTKHTYENGDYGGSADDSGLATSPVSLQSNNTEESLQSERSSSRKKKKKK